MEELAQVARQMLIDKAMANKDNWGVHERHCCPKYGCKYGDNDCPVVLGLTDKHNDHCEMCEWEYEEPNPLCVLYAWFKHEQEECNPARHKENIEYYSGICCEATYAKDMIRQLIKNPKKVVKDARKAGWFK